jgi:hypothetical protein
VSDSPDGIWKIADKLRAFGHEIQITYFLKEAKKQGITINNDLVESFLTMNPRICYEFPFPSIVRTFITELLKDRKPKSILDPWSGLGLSLARLTEAFDSEKSIGLTQNQEAKEVTSSLHNTPLREMKIGDPFTLIDTITERFDLIASGLPWGMERSSIKLNSEKGIVEVNDELGYLILLKSVMLLNQDGIGIFIVAPGFFFRFGSNSVYRNLSKLGLSIDGIFSIPRGTYSPFTNIGTLLLVIHRGQNENIFVGTLTNDSSARSVLISNFKKSKEGKEPELGMVIKSEDFISVDGSIQDRKISTISKNSGLSVHSLDKIATISMPKKSEDEEFKEQPNSMFLPIIGNSPAVVSLNDLHIKPQNYAQIVLDPKTAIASYVTQFYNSELGLLIRNRHLSGFIPKLSKERLMQSSIYLPDLETQIEAVRTQSLISDMATQIESKKRQLWNNPRKAKEIYNQIRSLNQENAFESWLESLPFPLASILWAYNSELDSQNKTLHLLHFFEALSELLTIISLSAYSSDQHIYQKYSATWLDNDQKYTNFQHSSFGDWVTISERLAKETRRLLSDEETREQCLTLFGRPNDDFIKMITNKAMYSSLREASSFRNNWIGHTGVVGKKTWDERLILAEDILAQIRKMITDNFSSMPLISPELSEFDKGVFHINVKMLMGTRIIFKKNIVNTLIPMEKNRLYLIANGQGLPLKLLPLVKIMESPRTEQNACYFYNRIEKEGVRWISYHFDSESEIVKPDDEVMQALSLLRQKKND